MLELRHLLEVKGTLTHVNRSRPNGVTHFHGTNFWGLSVVVKIAASGVLCSETNMVQILTSLHTIADIMRCYLFAGRVPVGVIAPWMDPDCPAVRKLLERSGENVDVIITEHFGVDLFAQCRAAAKSVCSDAQLEESTLKLLLRTFVVMKRLRDDGGCRHQDFKLDNIGEMDGRLCLIDFEFANSQSMSNDDAAIDGCAMCPHYRDGSDQFDIHTLIYTLLYFGGKRYRTLMRLETLRGSLLGPLWPTADPDHPYWNTAGESIVYMVRPPLNPCTYDTAIAVTRELIRLAV